MKTNFTTPFRFRNISNQTLITNEVGEYKFFDKDVMDRYFTNELSTEEEQLFADLSIKINESEDWKLYSLANKTRKHFSTRKNKIGYIMLIPTLRCNLSCSYCQVSRAPLNAKGYDWDEEKLLQYEKFIESLDLDHVKVEFQGGEPSLRTDLLSRIIDITIKHSSSAEFVICSNIVELTEEFKALIDRDDFFVSTSIDGSIEVMSANRTEDDGTSAQVMQNFDYILNTYGPTKISALPTVTEQQIEKPEELINTYLDLGFQNIFLRPVNYMGFARKQHKELSHQIDKWNNFYTKAMERILEINKTQYFEEFYLALLVRSIFSDYVIGHVDYRSPAWFLRDYCVVDFDGLIYPSDEARMLSRTRQVDLSMGNLERGFDSEKANELSTMAINNIHEDCTHCAYMPYCGIDVIDDMSRYKRFDIPKEDSWFCNRQMFLFDFIFSKIANKERAWLDLFLRWTIKSSRPISSYEVFR